MHHPRTPNVRNTSAVQNCTRGEVGLDNTNFPQGSAANTTFIIMPSPQPPRYNEDPYDSDMRHYYRPYPSIRGPLPQCMVIHPRNNSNIIVEMLMLI